MSLPPIVCYTHSSCHDVVHIYLRQLERCWPGADSYVLSNGIIGLGGKHKLIRYDDNEPHYRQWLTALESIPGNTFIYMQEDFILYDKVDLAAIELYRTVLECSQRFSDRDKRYSYVRLIASGENLGTRNIIGNLYDVGDKARPYSMMPSIWWKDDFIRIYETAKRTKPNEEYEYSDTAKELGIHGLYHYAGEPQRGTCHCDSKVFPFIATAVVKGLWNFHEYEKELTPLLSEHRIDPNKRGIAK